MEKHTFYKVVTELERDALYSDALAAKTTIEGIKKTRKIKTTESVLNEEKVHLGNLGDYEELETGHGMPRGGFKNIFELMMADLMAKPDNSPVTSVRAVGSFFVLEDVKKLAGRLLDKDALIRGIGPAKARVLLDGTSNLIGIAKSYPDSFG